MADAEKAAVVATEAVAAKLAALQTQVDYTVLSARQYKLVFATLMMLCFLVGLDITIVVTAMPKIAAQFNCLSEISWTVSAFLVAQTAVSPLAGRFTEAFGRRAVISVAVFVFTVFSLACALATTFAQLAIFRAMQGVGGGLVMPCVMVIISDITPMASRGVAMAPIMMIFTVSSIVGPLLGGALTDISAEGWRLCFYINVPIGAAALGVIFWCIPSTLGAHAAKFDVARAAAGVKSGSVNAAAEAAAAAAAADADADAEPGAGAGAPAALPKKAAFDLDIVGCVTVVIAVTSLALAITWGGGDYAWSDGRVFGLLVVAGVVGSFFAWWEVTQATNPVMPFRLFAVRNFWVANWVMFWSGFAMMATIVYLPVYFQTVWGQSATQSGISLIPQMLSFPFASIGAGVLMAKSGRYYWQPLVGAALLVVSCYLMTTFTPTTGSDQRVGFLILSGLGLGMTIATPSATAQAAVLGRDRAVTTTTVAFFGVLGRTISTAAGQALLNNAIPLQMAKVGAAYSVAQAMSDSVTQVFWLGVGAGAICLAGGVWCEHIPLSSGHADKPPAPAAGAAAPAAPAAAAAAAASSESDADADGAHTRVRGAVGTGAGDAALVVRAGGE